MSTNLSIVCRGFPMAAACIPKIRLPVIHRSTDEFTEKYTRIPPEMMANRRHWNGISVLVQSWQSLAEPLSKLGVPPLLLPVSLRLPSTSIRLEPLESPRSAGQWRVAPWSSRIPRWKWCCSLHHSDWVQLGMTNHFQWGLGTVVSTNNCNNLQQQSITWS